MHQKGVSIQLYIQVVGNCKKTNETIKFNHIDFAFY